jgi:hypothetical protein
LDGFGGSETGAGAPEIVTGGRDGINDFKAKRLRSSMGPKTEISGGEFGASWEGAGASWRLVCGVLIFVQDCRFGNSYNNEERVIAAGYDNGDLKFFDLRQNTLLWD